MKVGLIDVDGHNFPNLVLMKLSAWHKQKGDTVDWYSGIEHYDRVYLSKVFAFTEDDRRVIQADEIIKGGSGYKLYDQRLPLDIEHICPDYSLYHMYKSAYGFTTRGCVNKCSFCIVPRKEGRIKAHAKIEEFIGGRKEVILMDNNILACDHGLTQLEKAAGMKIKIDCNQGLDCRLIAKDKSIAKLLANVKWIKYIRMAYDSSAITEQVETAIAYLKEAGIPTWKMFFYVLARDGEINDAECRVLRLDYLGAEPFAMAYRDLDNNTPISREQQRFARWVNAKSIFRSCTWSDYKQ